MIMKRIMEQIPQLEVWARIVAGYMTGIKEIYKKNNVKKKKHIGNAPQVHKNVLIDYLKALKIQKGDILIVHSSLRPLKCFGMAPTEIIEELLKLVGDEGTLVMPAFCKYNEHIKGKFAEESVTEFVYNVQESPAWTGVISDTFWRREDVIRSRYPDNPLAATGSCAREIFMQEAQGDLAHGRYSSWKFCSDKHAKVLFLGIPAFNSITEIHLAEDLLDDRWPVKGWFKECHYKIIDNEKVYNKTTRIRKQFWSRYLTEYRCSYELRKQGLLKEECVETVPISFIPDLKKLEEYVTQKAIDGDLLIFKIPRKYYKNEQI